LTLANNIEITGIPKTPNENTNEIVTNMAQVLNCKCNSNDVIDSFRVKSCQNHDGKIIVKFNSKSIKNSIINNMKYR